MFVHFKQSGELLTSAGTELWTPDAVRSSAEKIRQAHLKRDDLNMEGLLVVSGAGNLIRGQKLKEHHLATNAEDALGRLATIQNTVVLMRALEQSGTPVTMFIADNMGFRDPSLGTIEPYTAEAVREAYDNERVVLIAGGTGEDNSTTDNAVLEYARRHKASSGEDDVLVLKGTKVEGVFDADPVKYGNAVRYSTISAHAMLADYGRFNVVDEPCLRAIIDTGLSLRVYKDVAHDLTAVIVGSSGGADIGTLIVPEEIEAVMAG